MEALESFKGFEAGAILGERLAPDMITFGEQFSVICNKVEAHIAKLNARRPAGTTRHRDVISGVEH
ncbi:DUF1993 family protein [Bradyrhizobium sp. CB2312]|uniref:DUF1993 family protein n=1 Tax=Bradyrhizobium sp. CB2312 TaxID=3039155 RepID=UPI0024B24D37|nr:DUF1993 family protein [Bradyrhizobium sp. CB2312]WFU74146.1 DUF1993 family protein [Bradyrhizobium sp. CB2312]